MDPRLRRLAALFLLLAAALVAAAIAVALLRPGAPDPELTLPDLEELASALAEEGSETLLAVGDIGNCDGGGDEAVADLASRLEGEIVLLGDIAYPDGSAQDFDECFDPAWGGLRDRLHPVPGNHEYRTSGASAYFEYFGDEAGTPGEGWYAWDHGPWRLLAVNSVCGEAGGCGVHSPQVAWISEQLSETDAACTLAYFHHPRYSSGRHGDAEFMEPIWRALVDGGVDLVLAGHDHSYERLLADGVRSFVVGTGGRSLYDFENPSPHSEARNNDAYGLLRLTLREGSYDWRFIALGGSDFTDAGSGECR
jgi:hypothetical protein